MPKKPILTTDEIISLIDEFYIKKCNYNANDLKIPQISTYICQQGYNVQAYTIRRNEEVRRHIEELRRGAKEQQYKTVVVFKTLDVNSFVEKHNTKDKLIKAIQERDNYYRDISTSAATIFKENGKITRTYQSQRQEIVELRTLLENTQEKENKAILENKRLQKENKALKSIIDTYVYPEIANELLVKSGLLKEGSGMIQKESVEENMVHADTDVQNLKNNVVKGLFDLL